MRAFLCIGSNIVMLLYEQELLCASAEFATCRLFHTKFLFYEFEKVNIYYLAGFYYLWKIRPVNMSYPVSQTAILKSHTKMSCVVFVFTTHKFQQNRRERQQVVYTFCHNTQS